MKPYKSPKSTHCPEGGDAWSACSLAFFASARRAVAWKRAHSGSWSYPFCLLLKSTKNVDYVNNYIYIHIHTYTYYIHIYIWICMCVCIYIYIHIHIHICIYIYEYVHTSSGHKWYKRNACLQTAALHNRVGALRFNQGCASIMLRLGGLVTSPTVICVRQNVPSQ